MAGFQIPMVKEGEIKKKRRIGRITSETDLLNILSVRTTGNLIESVQRKDKGETNFGLPQAVEFYLSGTFTDRFSYFFELEYESSEIEGKEDGLFENQSKFGLGKEFFLMFDLGRALKSAGIQPNQKDAMDGEGMGGPMIMGPMIMIGKIDPSTNFSYPTNRQFILNVPGRVDGDSGTIERFGLAPYAFASKFFGLQTATGKSVEVTKEVLYNSTGDFGVDLHAMIMPFMIQAGLMQGLKSGTADVNQKKDPYLMGRVNFGSERYLSGSFSGMVYWGNDTARVPTFAGNMEADLIDWRRYGFSGNIKYKLLDIYGAFIWDKISGLPDETLDVFDERATGLTVEGDLLVTDTLLLSLRYDQLDAGGFLAEKADGKALTAQVRYYLRDNLAFYLRDSYNIEEVSSNPLQNFRNLVTLGVDLDF